jgi:hypothetical protein
MKNILLLLSLCLVCSDTEAQKINKSLLNGKWNLYSMSGEGNTLYKDSINHNIAMIFAMQHKANPDEPISEADSLMVLGAAKGKFEAMFKTYAKFDDKGKTAMMLGFDADENGKTTEQTGTYKWIADNKISQTLGDSNPEIFVIVTLTAKKLTIRSDKTEDQEAQLEMSFTRE